MVNCVLIKDPVKDVYSLCATIYRLGVRQLGFAPYSANLSHFDRVLFHSREEYENLRLELSLVRRDFPDLLVHYPDPLELEEKLRRKSWNGVPQGSTALPFDLMARLRYVNS